MVLGDTGCCRALRGGVPDRSGIWSQGGYVDLSQPAGGGDRHSRGRIRDCRDHAAVSAMREEHSHEHKDEGMPLLRREANIN